MTHFYQNHRNTTEEKAILTLEQVVNSISGLDTSSIRYLYNTYKREVVVSNTVYPHLRYANNNFAIVTIGFYLYPFL